MTEDARLSKILTGIAGEFFVAAELTRRGYIVSITPHSTEDVDILAVHADTKQALTVQVKTSQGARNEWVLGVRAERAAADNHYFVFVSLKGLTDSPAYPIVPSSEVARYCRESHETWMATPGRGNRPHGSSNVRKFSDHENRYLDAWNILPE